MAQLLDIPGFIKQHITRRDRSLFQNDLNSFHNELSERLNGSSVLVIGGAGTIGSSYIKAILRFKIKSLYVIDVNENGLTELVRDLRSSTGYLLPEDFKTYPINYVDQVFENILREKGGFDIVANFAAHKHVRSEKDHHSIQAMINNNVIHARQLLNLLLEFPPKHFFCVSTDKAANPVNVMGASKKLMEDLMMSFSDKFPITTARFANVAFSNGSLLYGFVERLFKRQPLASPIDIKRYFVSPEESGQICLLACILGESGEIFFPKLDYNKDMMTFSSIAEKFLEELGLKALPCTSEEEAIRIANNLKPESNNYPVFFFKSDTSGEKSFEEFYTKNEQKDMERFNGLGVITKREESSLAIDEIINELHDFFENKKSKKPEIIRILKGYISNFEHIEKGKGLDQRM